LKQRALVCCRVTERQGHALFLLALMCLLALVIPASANAKSITFTKAELAFVDSETIPATGWEYHSIPAPILTEDLKRREKGAMTLWARMEFDRAALTQSSLSFYTINTRERFILYLNGVEVSRTFARKDDTVMGWNRPYRIPLPDSLLKQGTNQIMMRIDSGIRWHVGIGTVMVGPSAEMESLRSYAYFWRIRAVEIANGVALAGSAYALLLWLLGWRDKLLLIVGLSGAIWFMRNLHFIVERPPLDPILFREISQYLIYFVVALTFSFCAEFFDIKHKARFNLLQYSFAVSICILRYVLINNGISDVICNLLVLASGLTILYISASAFLKSRSINHGLILITIASVIAFSAHDIGRTTNVLAWDGLGFYLQPFSGFVMAWAFFLSIGRRYVQSIEDAANMNVVLEGRVANVTQELEKSEQVRRELEVLRAVEGERERLMREMHDGIGSNLVTALAVAEQQKQPSTTIQTLKRAISDLKITVDSLEPVDGDLVALLANLRHRMEGDLADAGLETVWTIEPCREIPWLDATNALHALRIFQEAIGNVISHARATEMQIGCCEESRNGVEGLVAFVSDNGVGFDVSGKTQGKGVANIKSRTQSLQGQLECISQVGAGTLLRVWLPYERQKPDVVAAPATLAVSKTKRNPDPTAG
jgi:signal transduction histidine kinase